MFNYKERINKQRYHQNDIDNVECQIRNLNNINNQRKEKFKKENEKIFGKPDSMFYGLRHKSKFQILDKYISDEYDVCPDIIDRIYECLKKKLINDNQDRFYKTELLKNRREQYLNTTYYISPRFEHIERLFKVNDYIDLGNIRLRVCSGWWQRTTFKIMTDKYDFTKDELMKMCDKSCIKYSKSWNKIKLFNLLLE
tara:strand:- start:117 stop:707 length:591 start_codon:yes stop_codon:yes gene_type:complete